MDMDARPVVVAFDGSEAAQAAVAAAAALFPARRIVVTSVWEPGLALAMAPLADPAGLGTVQPSAEEMAAVDRLQHDHAVDVADAGVRLAEERGANAEAYPVADEVDVAKTIVAVAERFDACAVVLGSRGLGGVKSRLFGSASRQVLRRCERPVVVVKAPQ